MKKIACFVGGGVKGVISAQIVNEIELQTGKPFVSHFDIISGTSTGSIIAAMLCEGYSGKDISKLFYKQADNIFNSPRNFLRRIYSSKYKLSNLKKILDHYIPDKQIYEVDKNLMIFSANKKKVAPKVFKSWHKDHITLADAILSSCAAPTYFDPYNNLIDGGVWANDPSIETYSEMQKFNKTNDSIKCLTIGTGFNQSSPSGKGKGFIYWGSNIVPLLMHIQQRRSEYVMDKLLKNNYVKLDPVLVNSSTDMDDASQSNLKSLYIDAAKFIHESPEFKKYKQII